MAVNSLQRYKKNYCYSEKLHKCTYLHGVDQSFTSSSIFCCSFYGSWKDLESVTPGRLSMKMEGIRCLSFIKEGNKLFAIQNRCFGLPFPEMRTLAHIFFFACSGKDVFLIPEEPFLEATDHCVANYHLNLNLLHLGSVYFAKVE